MALTNRLPALLKILTRRVSVLVVLASLCLPCLQTSLLEPGLDELAGDKPGSRIERLALSMPGSLVAWEGTGRLIIGKPANGTLLADGPAIWFDDSSIIKPGVRDELPTRFRFTLFALLDRGPPTLLFL